MRMPLKKQFDKFIEGTFISSHYIWQLKWNLYVPKHYSQKERQHERHKPGQGYQIYYTSVYKPIEAYDFINSESCCPLPVNI